MNADTIIDKNTFDFLFERHCVYMRGIVCFCYCSMLILQKQLHVKTCNDILLLNISPCFVLIENIRINESKAFLFVFTNIARILFEAILIQLVYSGLIDYLTKKLRTLSPYLNWVDKIDSPSSRLNREVVSTRTRHERDQYRTNSIDSLNLSRLSYDIDSASCASIFIVFFWHIYGYTSIGFKSKRGVNLREWKSRLFFSLESFDFNKIEHVWYLGNCQSLSWIHLCTLLLHIHRGITTGERPRMYYFIKSQLKKYLIAQLLPRSSFNVGLSFPLIFSCVKSILKILKHETYNRWRQTMIHTPWL